MASVFESFQRLGPAAFVLEAILAAVILDGLLLGFILLRRGYRRRFFARRDARVFDIRQQWAAIISGTLPFDTWRNKPFDCHIVQAIALDAFEAAEPTESAQLRKFLRSSGLVDRLIFDAQQLHGWRQRRALVALGRTRAPEGIATLAEGLRDRPLETRLAALRGLSRTASPEAAQEILRWVGEVGLAVPPLPLQDALVQCCAENPQVLLPHLRRAQGAVREVLGRVLGEVATPALGRELLEFAKDELSELRAATARGLGHAPPALALEVLGVLAQDPVWFVRLRALVGLAKLSHPGAVPLLLRGLSDTNRLVRLRAAEGLVKPETEMVPVFAQVAACEDQYGLHAYCTALENAGLRAKLEAELATSPRVSELERKRLFDLLRSGKRPAEPLSKTTPLGTGPHP
jgi:HEAT repeat protein